MATFELGSVSISVDEDGFMMEPEAWNEDVAAALATTQLFIMYYDDIFFSNATLSDYYLQFGVAPMIRKLCKQTGFQLKEIYELFPSGPAKGACKVAGLPKPTGCV